MFVSLTPTSASQAVVEDRVSGLDRYATAALVAQATFAAPNPNIILVSGENFPDGLASAGLAGAANAPILLTTPNVLPAVTANAMAALFGASVTKTVHIIGGTSAVSAAVATQVQALGYTVNRVAGADRYATAAAVAAFQATLAPVGITFVAGAPLRTAIVATGQNFPDALSAGGGAFFGKHPILLTQTATLPAVTSSALTSLSIQRVILLGGTSAVSAAVESAIAAQGILVSRLAGADRGATAKAVADAFVATAAAGGLNFYGGAASAACLTVGGVVQAGPNVALVVDGDNFADAMSAAPHSGTCRAPILLGGSSSTTAFMTANSASVGIVRAIGGLNAVSAAELTAAKTAATQNTPTAVVGANIAHNVISVTFSEAMATVNAGTIKVNNGADLCAADVALGATLAVGTCSYTTSAAGITTVWTLAPANLALNDVVTASGFLTIGLSPRVAATASKSVTAAAALTAAVAGATAGASTHTITYSRPVVTTGTVLADVTVTRATVAAGVPQPAAGVVFATALAAQIGTTLTVTPNAAIGALQVGDIITVKPTATTGVAGGALAANLTFVVGPAGAKPVASAVTGVMSEVGGVLLTNAGDINTNVVVQSKAARPDTGTDAVTDSGTLRVAIIQGAGLSVATSATAALDATTGITLITVTLGTDAAGAANGTAAKVAAALNAGALTSPLVTASASNPASVAVPLTLGATDVAAGTRTLIATVTASKPLAAVAAGLIDYDANGDGFAEVVGSAGPSPALVVGATSFTVALNLRVGLTAVPAPVAVTSKLRLNAGALTDTTVQTNVNGQVNFS